MQIDQMRTHLTTLKLYMSRIEEFVKEAGTMVCEIEERLMDMEDELYCQKYSSKNNIQKLNVAENHYISPARLRIDRCSEHDIKLAAFIQEFSKLNNLMEKRN